MVNSISQTPKTTKTSIFYINDVHGRITNMERLKTAADAFDAFVPQEKSDKLKFASGDILLGEDTKLNQAAVKFQNSIGITASAIGNHEFDMQPKDLVELTRNAKYKMLGFNTIIDPKNPLKQTIIRSYIEEKDGNKYGIIGLMPFDLFSRVKVRKDFEGFKIEDINAAIKDMQAEVDKLQKAGVNKVIVLSHAGYTADVKFAKEVTGIDVILGGHSHDLIKDIKENQNLFYSKNGEPVVVTQAGRDGNYFGVLNLEFNDKGVITKAQNNITETKKFKRNMPLKFVVDSVLGKPETVGTILNAPPSPSVMLIEENPHASFMADAVKSELNTDIAMINSGNIRGAFEAGPVDTMDISGVAPFKNKMTIIKINEKELVDALKFGAKSLTTPDNKPGILQVSGLKYTTNKSGQLLKLSSVNKDGKETPINIDNPNTFKTYRLAIDDYYAQGRDGFEMLNKYNVAEAKFDFDKDKLVADFIRKQGKPIDIKSDGRIQIVD